MGEMLTIIDKSGGFDGDQVAEAQRCVAALDVDKDGRVSYPEFLLVWKSRSTKLACYNIQQTCSIYPAPFSEACQRHAVNAINFCSENPLNIITRMALSSILRKMLVHR